MKRLIIGVTVVAACLVGFSAPAQAEVRRALLTGLQENPDIVTAAHGAFTAIIAQNLSKIDFVLRYEGLEGGDPLFAHIHVGKPGVNGGISVFLCGGGGKPACPPAPAGVSVTVTGTLLPADITGPTGQGVTAGVFDDLLFAMRRRATYVNVHTPTYPSGEIRGQIQ
jgi:hypothetical protein